MSDSFRIREIEDRLSELRSKFILNSDEFLEQLPLQNELDNLVGPADPRHRCMFDHDAEYDCITIYWGNYAYDLDLEPMSDPVLAISAIAHVAQKRWRHSTPRRVSYLIGEVMRVKGWSEFEPMRHPNEAPPPFVDPDAERAKMTSTLRYEVIKRDGYRCRACGFSVKDGARLHVDHIQPVSKGGKSERKNLQTLCAACNLGKGAS